MCNQRTRARGIEVRPHCKHSALLNCVVCACKQTLAGGRGLSKTRALCLSGLQGMFETVRVCAGGTFTEAALRPCGLQGMFKTVCVAAGGSSFLCLCGLQGMFETVRV